MKYIYAILFLLCFSSIVNAQCSIKNSKRADGTTIQEASFEVLYKNVGDNNNGDYGRGFTQIHGRLARISRQNPSLSLLELQVTVSAHPSSNLLVPRQIVFHFVNGSTLSLNAITYHELEKGIQLCEYEVTDQGRSLLKNPIREIDIIDTRAEQKYVGKKEFGLYDRVLAEQLTCLD